MPIEGLFVDYPAYDTMLNYEATEHGRSIFNLLKSQARIILLSSDPYADRVKQWLLRERLTGYAMVYSKPVDNQLTPAKWKIEQMTSLMGIGHQFTYYVDTDPAVITAALSEGIAGLLLTIPQKHPGQDRPTNPTPWYDLVKRVDEQNAVRAEQAQRESDNDDSAG